MLQENPYRAAGTFVGKSYIVRRADHALQKAIQAKNKYSYLLAPRQSGKSSILEHTKRALSSESLRFAMVDLSVFPLRTMGQYDSFFENFVEVVFEEFGVGTSLLDELAELKGQPRFLLKSFRLLLRDQDAHFVVCIDEIDALLNTHVKDDFLKQIRALFNERAKDPSFNHLQFVLAGAIPSDSLISDSRGSPFNIIGEEILLEDLDLARIKRLLAFAGALSDAALEEAAARLLHWTGGSVYLCQHILETAYQEGAFQDHAFTASEVIDSIVDLTITKAPHIIHFTNIAKLLLADASLLKAWLRWYEKEPPDISIQNKLSLVGLSKPAKLFRNSIYEHVFGVDGPLCLIPDAIESFKHTEEHLALMQKKRYAYYVSLDLGSESTAAFFEERRVMRSGMVELQTYARLPFADEPAYLMNTNGTISPRLRTRFRLNGSRQPASPLPPNHALLDFVDIKANPIVSKPDYDKTIFEYFRPLKDGLSLIGKNMPNPKIPFQMGGAEVIPPLDVVGKQYEQTRYKPAELIQHMIVQMIRNFVLLSPQLKAVPLEAIHLTVTVPNVYSLSHVEIIKQFVQQYAGLNPDAIDMLYESDAVAYSLLRPPQTTDSEDFREVSRHMAEAQDRFRIITFDIGRGTTDLSLIQIAPKRMDDGSLRRVHRVLARTGRSDGGNKLNYLFAEYYNQQLENHALWFTEYAGVAPPFDFLTAFGGVMGSEQGLAIGLLEELIEKIKRSMAPNYRIRLEKATQVEYLDKIINLLFQDIGQDWEATNPETAGKVRQVLRDAFLLPPKLPVDSLGSLFRNKRTALQTLAEKIKKYVEDIVGMMEELEEIAAAMQQEEKRKAKKRATSGQDPSEAQAARDEARITDKVYDQGHTFVLVAGQASQLGPLCRAIKGKCNELGFRGRYCFLEQDEAKEACSKGAILYHVAEHKFENPKELHGFYGFVRRVGTGGKFEPVPMEDLRQGGTTMVGVKYPGDYMFIYSTRPDLTERDVVLGDSSLAIIGSFAPRISAPDVPGEYYFLVEYDKTALTILINGEPIREIGTFGALDTPIYPKVWPDLLNPK